MANQSRAAPHDDTLDAAAWMLAVAEKHLLFQPANARYRIHTCCWRGGENAPPQYLQYSAEE
jgi:hypothetical protein